MSTNYKLHAYQTTRLKKVINIAGPRYDTRVNVEVPLSQVFEALCRTDNFYDEVRRMKAKLANRYKDVGRINEPTLSLKYVALDKSSKALMRLLNDVKASDRINRINWQKVLKTANDIARVCYELADELRRLPPNKSGGADRSNDGEINYIYRFLDPVNKLINYAEGKASSATNKSRLLMIGEAGIGKTHLLCDLAEDRLKRKLPTYIFLGEEFTISDPLINISRLVSGGDNYEKVLKELDKVGKKTNQRVLIIVDAVNEAQASVTWSALNKIKDYKNIAYVISIRRGYEGAILTKTYIESLISIEHEGFSIDEFSAVSAFFSFFRVPLPDVPILAPEFRNPLFLKLFCETYDKPSDFRGHVGTTKLFEAYVKKQGKNVMKAMGLVNDNSIWDKVIRSLAKWMGANGTERILEAKILELLELEMPGKSKQLLIELQRHWLLTKVPHYTKTGKVNGSEYRFPYQRFSDHFIVRYLLNTHLNKTDPKKSFYANKALGKILAQPYRFAGLVEALSIQVPERLKGVDLIDVSNKAFKDSQSAKDSFLYSLIWRSLAQTNGKSKCFNVDAILRYINKFLLSDEVYFHETLVTFYSVTGLPDHPLNSKLLHGYLWNFTMPKRDAFFQKFLHYNYEQGGMLDRLIEWAWSSIDKSRVSSDSLELTCTSMTWMLASSDRTLRDRTTKAMVSALTDRLEVVEKLLKRFEKVNDPYVLERLFAVAYGCCLRSKKTAHLKRLARFVYESQFASGIPTVNILTRDYARGVIEVYRLDNADPDLDPKLFRSPYNSAWPERMPTLSTLKARYRPDDAADEEKYKYSSIWSSVMHSNGAGIADFGNYVVDSNLTNFSGKRLDSTKLSEKELLNEFKLNARKEDLELLEEVKSYNSLMSAASLKPLLESLLKSHENTDEETENPKDIQKGIVKLTELLARPENNGYKVAVTKYMNGQSIPSYTEFEYAKAQRWIFKRVIQLGWDPKIHGKYDRFERDRSSNGRDSRERIGKKYQWIALFELLARVADNFEMKPDNGIVEKYISPAQLSIRDIDPSHVLKNSSVSHDNNWWFPIKYDGWKIELSEEQWKSKVTKDLPDFKKIIQVKDINGKKWLSLKGYYQWDQLIDIEDEERKYDLRRREVWYQVYGYVIKKSEVKAFHTWAMKQNFWNHWMPESHEFYSVFFREFPYYPAFESINKPYYGRSGWVKPDRPREGNDSIDVKIMVANDEYMQEGNTSDASVEEGFSIQIPSAYMYKDLKLSSGFPDGSYRLPDDSIALFDPSLVESGPKALLANQDILISWLQKNDLTLCWTVLGEKMGIGGNRMDRTGRLMINGSYTLQGDKVVGKISTKYEA